MAKKVQRMDNDYTKKKRIQIKASRVVRKRMMVFGGSLLFLLLVLTALLFVQIKENRDLKAAYNEETVRLEELKDKEIAYNEKLKQLNSKEYITKIARSEYFLSNDGEIIFKIPEDKDK